MFTYLLINLFSISIPLIYSFNRRLNFYKNWYAFWPACLATLAVFIAWDIYFTQIGVWGFNPKYLTGHYLFNLPVEEWLFFICIPYACVFTYHCMNRLVKNDYFKNIEKPLTFLLIAILLILAVLNWGKLYTTTTFVATAAFLLLLNFAKVRYLSRFYFTYMVVLIPFFCVNGILTGTLLQEQVVWYNNAENLGFRLGTIPFEDIFYGLLLILMNVTLYEAIIYFRTGGLNNQTFSKWNLGRFYGR